jgi:hypothetical protein
MERAGFGILALPADHDVAALHFGLGAGGQFQLEFALGSLDRDLAATDVHLHLGRDDDGLFSNARHEC